MGVHESVCVGVCVCVCVCVCMRESPAALVMAELGQMQDYW